MPRVLRLLLVSLLWAGSYLVIVAWEVWNIPMVSHSDSWRGVWLSILAILVVSHLLARTGVRMRKLFLYGCGSSILFVLRFIEQDRFDFWVKRHAPRDGDEFAILLGWYMFMVVMGGLCAVSGYRHKLTAREAEQTVDDKGTRAEPLSSTHQISLRAFLVFMACAALGFACLRAFGSTCVPALSGILGGFAGYLLARAWSPPRPLFVLGGFGVGGAIGLLLFDLSFNGNDTSDVALCLFLANGLVWVVSLFCLRRKTSRCP